MRRDDVMWAELGEPNGSEPGYRRQVLIIQSEALNVSRLATVVVLSMTSNTELRRRPGCVLLTAEETGLPKDSVVNAAQISTVDRTHLDEHVGQVDDAVTVAVDGALRRGLS